jgi:RNA polymerase sigma-70 factor (ECF subfamily)
MTLDHIDGRLCEDARARDVAFQMDEELFRAFYDRTSRGLAGYLVRLCGDRQQAADLLQETYYRFLRAEAVLESEAHRRNYLYRIATNLVRDQRRRPAPPQVPLDEPGAPELAGDTRTAARLEQRHDLDAAMAGLRPRDRAMLWLAYAHGSSHDEIAGVVGVKTASVKLMLFRARQRLAERLRARSGQPAQERSR